MRLTLLLPPGQPEVYPAVDACPDAGCGGRSRQPWQAVPKPLRDTVHRDVVAQRYRCLRCGSTFRVYPVGVSHDQTSARLKGVAVMLYVLGMSYGAVATALTALGWPLSKVAIYYAVQEAGAAVAGLRREAVRHGGGRVRVQRPADQPRRHPVDAHHPVEGGPGCPVDRGTHDRGGRLGGGALDDAGHAHRGVYPPHLRLGAGEWQAGRPHLSGPLPDRRRADHRGLGGARRPQFAGPVRCRRGVRAAGDLTVPPGRRPAETARGDCQTAVPT